MMSTKKSGTIGLAAVAIAVVLAGCGTAQAPEEPSPATVRPVAGSSIPRLQLTDQAIRRLGIATQPVRMATVTIASRRGPEKVIPYSAVIYDNDGSTWSYVNTAPRTFTRERIAVLVIRGHVAILGRGPAAGSPVVTVGAPELLGTEYNISGEE
jgi:hypothetical protein